MSAVVRAVYVFCFVAFFATPITSLAQEVNVDDSTITISNGNLNAFFVMTIPSGTLPSQATSMITDNLVNWMNTVAPVAVTPELTVVSIKVIVKKGWFTAYAFHIVTDKSAGDSWESMLPGSVSDYINETTTYLQNGYDSEGGDGGMDGDSDTLAPDSSSLVYPPNAIIMIGGGSGIVTCDPGCFG